jgi:hypothetical protein
VSHLQKKTWLSYLVSYRRKSRLLYFYPHRLLNIPGTYYFYNPVFDPSCLLSKVRVTSGQYAWFEIRTTKEMERRGCCGIIEGLGISWATKAAAASTGSRSSLSMGVQETRIHCPPRDEICAISQIRT